MKIGSNFLKICHNFQKWGNFVDKSGGFWVIFSINRVVLG